MSWPPKWPRADSDLFAGCLPPRLTTRFTVEPCLRRRPERGLWRGAAVTRCCLHSRQPRIPGSSRRRRPQAPAGARQSPQGHGRKALPLPEIPAYSHPARKRQDRPVTPEVAGSSPVAPAVNILHIGMFCCQDGRERPLAFCVSRSDPARPGKWLVSRHCLVFDPAIRRHHPAREFGAAAISAALRTPVRPGLGAVNWSSGSPLLGAEPRTERKNRNFQWVDDLRLGITRLEGLVPPSICTALAGCTTQARCLGRERQAAPWPPTTSA